MIHFVAKMNFEISKMVLQNKSTTEISKYVQTYIDKNMDELSNIATKNICIANGGFITPNDKCSFTEQNCKNDEKPPPPADCEKEIDPATYCKADKYKNCLADYDMDKVWSKTMGKCIATSTLIKKMCLDNGLKYNVDKNICELTEEICRSKAGTPFKADDGSWDCKVPVFQIILESLFSQVFDKRQYKCPREGLIDNSDPTFRESVQDMGICAAMGNSYAIKELAMYGLDQTAINEEGKATMDIILEILALIGLPFSALYSPLCAAWALSYKYTCKEPCKDDETYALFMCWKKDFSFKPEPCDEGYTFDKALTCWADTKMVKLSGEIPNKCPPGYKLLGLGPLCEKRDCNTEGDIDVGALCREKCIDGYEDVGGVCWKKGSKGLVELKMPIREECDRDYNFDGVTTCWQKETHTRGPGIVPNDCGPNYELVGITCWQKCHESETDKGATCEICKDGFVNNGATTCYKPCLDGYEYDGSFGCNTKPIMVDALPLTQCKPNYDLVGVTCWEKCAEGDKDKGATCEECPEGYKNNGATLCYKPCRDKYTYDGTSGCNFNPVTVGAGIVPEKCRDGYKFFGGLCYNTKCDPGYVYDGQMTCKRDDKMLGTATPCKREQSCNGLENVIYGAGTCSGWDKNANCVDLCKSCTYDNYTWGCDSGRCGDNCAGGCDGCGWKGWKCCWNSCKWKTPKCCDNGLKTTLTGINCSKCGTYKNCTGGVVTRNSGYYCDGGKEKKGLLCYDTCPAGYKYNDPNVPVSCVPENANRGLFYTQTDNHMPMCASNRDMVAGLCYEKCPEGLERINGIPTNCKPIGQGIAYQTDTAVPKVKSKGSHQATCRDDTDQIGLLCYKKCPILPYAQLNDEEKKKWATRADYDKANDNDKPTLDRVPGIPTQCQGRRGLNYITENHVPKTYGKGAHEAGCRSNREKKDSLCYKKCEDLFGQCFVPNPGAPTECMPSRGISYVAPFERCTDGLVDNGASMCANNYVPKTYGKGNVEADCSDGYDKVDGLCYEKCPEGMCHVDLMPTQCARPRDGKCPLSYSVGLPAYIPKIVGKIRAVEFSKKD